MGLRVTRSSPHVFARERKHDAFSKNARAKQKGLQLLGTLFIYCEFLVGRAGLEPATNGLKVRCSTN